MEQKVRYNTYIDLYSHRREVNMISLIELHSTLLKMISDIKHDQYDNMTNYIVVLEQIDRILISIDIIAHGEKQD